MRPLHHASHASARVEREARSHRRVADGLGTGGKEVSGARALACGHAAQRARLRQSRRGRLQKRGATNNEETRRLRVSQE